MGAPKYVGIFLTPRSRQELLRLVPPTHPVVHADHVTLAIDPTEEQLNTVELGSIVRFELLKAHDVNGAQAVTVRVPSGLATLMGRRTPHVTISTDAGVPPARSNDAVKRPGDHVHGTLTGILDVPKRLHPVHTQRFPLASRVAAAWLIRKMR
jgi:hypothetical protein